MQGSLPNLAAIQPTIQAHAQTLADELATFLAGQTEETMKHPTGTFRDSLSGAVQTSDDGVTVQVVSSDPLAAVKLEPTSAHEIQGNPVLHFNWNGAERFFRSVHHPGTVGWGVVVESLNENMLQIVDDDLQLAVQEALTQ